MTKDELAQQSIEQLHGAVIECSKNCFELKKLCATVIGSSITLLAAFTAQRIDPAFFVGGAIIVGFFWMADAQSYYYQEKIRIQMKKLQRDLLEGNNTKPIDSGVGMPISQDREKMPTKTRVIHSVFNWSMTFYFGLLLIDAILVVTYLLGWIHTRS